MPRKLIHCPHCTTQYRVKLEELNLSQGSLRCAKCDQIFNLTHTTSENGQSSVPSYFQINQLDDSAQLANNKLIGNTTIHRDVNEFFLQKIEYSNVNLLNYLNHLDKTLYQKETSQTVSKKSNHTQQQKPILSRLSKLMLVIVLSLCLLLLFYFTAD